MEPNSVIRYESVTSNVMLRISEKSISSMSSRGLVDLVVSQILIFWSTHPNAINLDRGTMRPT
jgi:hypothetical protein